MPESFHPGRYCFMVFRFGRKNHCSARRCGHTESDSPSARSQIFGLLNADLVLRFDERLLSFKSKDLISCKQRCASCAPPMFECDEHCPKHRPNTRLAFRRPVQIIVLLFVSIRWSGLRTCNPIKSNKSEKEASARAASGRSSGLKRSFSAPLLEKGAKRSLNTFKWLSLPEMSRIGQWRRSLLQTGSEDLEGMPSNVLQKILFAMCASPMQEIMLILIFSIIWKQAGRVSRTGTITTECTTWSTWST